jgi:Putative Ig domain
MSTVISYKGPIKPASVWPAIYRAIPILHGSSGGPITPVPVAEQLKGGTVGAAYSETISAQGGTSPYTFSLLSGALPTGTSLNSSTGVISGTLSATGAFAFTIKATDSLGAFGSQNFSITIASPPPSANSGRAF